MRARIHAIAAASALLLSAIPPLPALSAGFSDVRTGMQYGTAIDDLRDAGVVEGYADGSFKPGASINRAEFLKIVLEGREDGSMITGQDCFPDVRSEWFARYVCFAQAEGIIDGYPDGTFKPDQNISFVEAAKILSLAFKQSPQSGGSEWYEGYARALEDSKAIPPTVNGLDQQLTRGEMAEMLWRLTEQKKDQPTKGFLNVKHPELSINLAKDGVQQPASCRDLTAFVATQQEEQQGGGYYGGTSGGPVMMRNMDMPMEDAAAKAESTAGMAPPAPSGGDEGDYSQTNVQVAGVDEADIVKTDGTNLYLVRGQSVRIVRVSPADTMEELSEIRVDDDNFTPTELYVDDGKLILLGTSYRTINRPGPLPYMDGGITGGGMVKRMMAPWYYPTTFSVPRTVVRVYDIGNGKNPKILRTLSFDGSEISSRRINDRLYLVLRQDMPYYYGIRPMEKSVTDDKVVPTFTDSASGDAEIAVAPCSKVSILPHVPNPTYMIVASIPTDGDGTVKREVILGAGDTVYASTKNLYVAQTEWSYQWDPRQPQSTEKTRIFRFAFTSDGDIDLKADGTVPGHVLNQFSMDEHEDALRIATMTNGWTEEHPSATNVYILDASMKRLGEIENIAPGEQMYSARFMGKRGYLVTFKTVDPLFVVDLADPRNPAILGKLKIPGYSNYLHPYDDTHLIGFGKEVDESIDKDKVHSNDAVYYTAVLGVKVAMFDVSDVERPKELFKEVIGGRGSDSPVLTNHKALLLEKDRGLMAFPVLVTSMTEKEKMDGTQGSPIFQGAYVYDVSLQKGFHLRGAISHYDDKSVYAKTGSYWYNMGSDVERIVRVRDSLITVSPQRVRSHTLSEISLEGSVDLKEEPGYSPGYWEDGSSIME